MTSIVDDAPIDSRLGAPDHNPAGPAPEVRLDWDPMDTLILNPTAVALTLNAGALWGIGDVDGRYLCGDLATALTMTLVPPHQAQQEGFELERARVVALRTREVLVYPLGAKRRWMHRNPGHPGSLCLQHPSDDPSLLWLWEDGLGRLLTRVRLHLLYEQSWRRTGTWPGVDLPHGSPPDGRLEPVVDSLLRKGMRRWAR